MTRAWIWKTFMIFVQLTRNATLLGIVLIHMFAIAMIATESMHLSKDTTDCQQQQEKHFKDLHYYFLQTTKTKKTSKRRQPNTSFYNKLVMQWWCPLNTTQLDQSKWDDKTSKSALSNILYDKQFLSLQSIIITTVN